jgi:Ni,Fe-hydrogenase I small subunit
LVATRKYRHGSTLGHFWGDGELDPFVLVVEGSIPNEAIKSEGYWCGFGNNPATGQPMTTNEWLDRLAPKATAVLAVGTCATYGGIHAMAGNPTGAMGVPDYLGWDWRSKAGLPIVCVPGCPIHPDNLSETILYLLYQVAGQAPMIPLDEALRPTITSSPEVRKMASDAIAAAEQMVKRAPVGGISGSVVRTLASCATTRRETSRAA